MISKKGSTFKIMVTKELTRASTEYEKRNYKYIDTSRSLHQL
jgi:hypothetical protein